MDKAGQPYLLHPLRLMRRVGTETEKIVAVLHDVIEDSQPPQRWGFDELRREGFSEPVLTALEGVTRREGETCEEFIRRSLAPLTDRAAERLRRYLAAWRVLTGAE